GWEVAPLTTNAGARRQMRAVLDERSATKAHKAPVEAPHRLTGRIFGDRWNEAPPPDEGEGRLLLALWLMGADQKTFECFATSAIGTKNDAALELLRSLCFDATAVTDTDASCKNLAKGWAGLLKGQTLLHW